MSIPYIMADPHFGHKNIIHMPGRAGMWATIEEHDEALVANANKVLTKRDLLYVLGDIGMDKPQGYVTHGILPRLGNGCRKIVVGGNHDTAEILRGFDKVNGVLTKSVAGYRIVMTHIPIHPQEMYWDLNIHGHLHANHVWKNANDPAMGKRVGGEKDPRYLCVSMENIGFTPVNLMDLVEQHMDRWEKDINKFNRGDKRR